MHKKDTKIEVIETYKTFFYDRSFLHGLTVNAIIICLDTSDDRNLQLKVSKTFLFYERSFFKKLILKCYQQC